MRNKNFCHLHVHSTFSKLDGFGYPKAYMEKAKKMGFEFLACTDHGNIDGLIKLQQASKETGIKPVFGCEAYISKEQSKDSPTGHISLWIKNQTGFENICKMLSEANLKGFYRKPRISFESLLANKEGLVIGTACLQSFVKLKGGEEFFELLKKEIGDDLYIEIMPHNIKQQIDFNRSMIQLAKRTGTKIIVTNDCHYIKKSDNEIQEVMLAIQSKKTWNDPKRWKFTITGLHLKSAEGMKRALKEIGFYKEEYLTNTIEIAKKCSGFSIPKREINLPRVPGVPINPIKARKFFLELCRKGYFEIFGHQIEKNKVYKKRLESEYDLIIEKKFEKYFFIVWELCSWCKQNSILIGPGRGSVGGSLVAYLLGITSVDPIKHNLFFDRFINRDRIDYPDIDIDFEDVKRHLIKQHLETIYGENRIAGVSSFSRLQTRAAIQDVARVFEVPFAEVNSFTKFIDDMDNSPIAEKIENAIRENQECRLFAEKYPKVIQISKRIGGQVRGTSQHAAALVISKDDIGESGRCNLVERNNVKLINWEKDDAEYMGLMKLDALGLKLLSILSHCLELIKKNQKKEIDLNKIDLEDKKVLEQINKGKNIGVFQLGTWATTSLLKEMGVDKFQNVVDAIALVRPGPMNSGMTSDYIKRKNGEKYKLTHPVYDKLTEETFGLLIYQEQVMAVINKVAGLPYSTADKIRKIIGKKRDKEEFQKYEDLFKEGCRKTKIFSPLEANNFWVGLQEWVRYGFNKCCLGDTLLERANYNQYSGKFITVKDLYIEWNKETPASKKYKDPKRGLQILQDVNGVIKPGKVKNVFYQGKRIVFKIMTEGKREFIGTRNHKLKTYNGYKKIIEMKAGEWLAVKGPPIREIKEKINKGGNGWAKGLKWENGKPPEKEGQRKFLDTSRPIIKQRANGHCEICDKDLKNDPRPEFAHIKELKSFKFDYKKYHSPSNVQLLCNSCHKQIDKETRGWFKKGYQVVYDKIISIEYAGVQDVFDLEMEGSIHNFIANGIVSHNSHSVEYAILGIWCAYLKHYFPLEFICASLTHGDEKKKPELIEEAYKLGLSVILPKVGKSDPFEWTTKNNCLYIPFIEVKGIGRIKAIEAAAGGKKDRQPAQDCSFFVKTEEPEETFSKPKGQFGKLLIEMGAYQKTNPEITEKIKSLFKFRVITNPKSQYKRIYETIPGLTLKELDPALEGDLTILPRAKESIGRIAFKGHSDLHSCGLCELVEECKAPVAPSKGKTNVVIIGEAPGQQEDDSRQGFIGRSGKKIWNFLKKKKYSRNLFHITNVVKCFPSKSKRPNKKQIEICGKNFLEKELLEISPILILAFGNTSLEFLKGQKSGIMAMSGKIEWVEKYGSWVVWCLHPAASLHNPENEVYFNRGMKKFTDALKALGIIDRSATVK